LVGGEFPVGAALAKFGIVENANVNAAAVRNNFFISFPPIKRSPPGLKRIPNSRVSSMGCGIYTQPVPKSND
jgi:hypothetical protein